jgi:hypothetical protein
VVNLLVFMASLFPYDPRIDLPMGHSYLVAVYAVVWAGHLGYAGFVAYKWRLLVKERAAKRFVE